jgi:hypothetical protein
MAGTNPTNGLSAFRIRSASRLGNDVLLSWTTAPGRTNIVQTQTPLDPGGFADISGPIVLYGPGDGATNFLHLGGALGPERYYRIRIPQ